MSRPERWLLGNESVTHGHWVMRYSICIYIRHRGAHVLEKQPFPTTHALIAYLDQVVKRKQYEGDH
jgi:hypothetical protein